MRILGLNGIIVWAIIFLIILGYGYMLYVIKTIYDAIGWIIVFGGPAAYLLYRQIKDERLRKREHSRNT